MPSKKEKLPLSVTHPELAKEAYGWDPNQFSYGSDRRVEWVCSFRHVWTTSISHRAINKSNCPICWGRTVLVGFNDLQSKNPELAKEAYGWDPTSVTASSSKKLPWICADGHTWVATAAHRTNMKSGCPVCAGKKILPGLNDLMTVNPDLGREAEGWDPSTVAPSTAKKFPWQCSLGHIWIESVNKRARGDGCPYCSGHRVLQGFNDLATTNPEVLQFVDGWDPTEVTTFSDKRRNWKCELGHRWNAQIKGIGKGTRCPFCTGKKVLIGFNDLATTHPEIATQAEDWNPEEFTAGSNRRLPWRCPNGHKWSTQVSARTLGTGCPSCAKYGFDPNKDGFLYFLKHAPWGMLQIGITNIPDDRLKNHRHLGWELLELRGPMDGHLVQQWETAILRMLKAKGADLSNEKIAGKFDGYSEAWSKSTFEVSSIKELMRMTEEFEDN